MTDFSINPKGHLYRLTKQGPREKPIIFLQRQTLIKTINV